VVAWLEEMVTFAAQLTTRARGGGLTTHREAAHWTPVFVLEGFLYDIPLHDLAISHARVAPIEQRLTSLGFTLVLLSVPPNRIQQQCVISTREHRGPGWSAHLRRFGATDTERAVAFGAAQQRLYDWVASGPLSVIEFDTSAGNWAQITTTVVEILRDGGAAGPSS
jgi:hypothetical protein